MGLAVNQVAFGLRGFESLPAHMNYSGILKKAYHITIKNKILWLLGMMVGGGASCNYSFSGNYGDINKPEINFNSINLWDYWYILALIAVLIIFLLLIFIVLSVIARGGLLHGVNNARDNKKALFWESFKFGAGKFWRVLGLQLLFGLIILAGVIILVMGILMFVIVGVVSHLTILKILLILLGILFSLLGITVIVILAILIGLISNYVYCYAILDNKRISESLKLGYGLFKKNIGETLILCVILFGIGLGIGLVLMMIIIPLLLIFAAIGFGFYFLLSWPGVIIISAIALIIFLIITFVIKGILNTFMFSSWVNAWHELVDKK